MKERVDLVHALYLTCELWQAGHWRNNNKQLQEQHEEEEGEKKEVKSIYLSFSFYFSSTPLAASHERGTKCHTAILP